MSMSGKQMMALEALLLEELIAERDSLRKRVKDLEKQPKQKPVAVFDEKFGRPKMLANAPILTHGQKFYTTPPRREWVGLTQEDIEWCYEKQKQTFNRYKNSVHGQQITEFDDPDYHLILAVTAKLKQKNGYAEEKNT